MKFLKGKTADYADTKGYITGAFFPEDTLNYSQDIEINYSKLSDDFSASNHLHSKSKTWVIVTKGKMYFRIDGTDIEVGQGEFVIFEANVSEEVVRVEPGTESITIHSPSIKGGDKVVLK